MTRQGLFAVGLGLGLIFSAAKAEETNNIPSELGLRDFIRLVLERNETIQMRLLEFAITEKRHAAEQGIFEPELVLGYDRVENDRQNTAEQRRSAGVSVFSEGNNLYNGGIESLVPTGARIRLGYALRDLQNNLQDLGTTPPLGGIITNLGGTGREYQTFVGVSVTQPLLKSGWNSSTLANIRLAALGSDIAFQDYRRQMMVILSTAEATYWNLFLAQEQTRFFEESVAVAESLVRDNRARVDAGRGSELDVAQAQAGLALRRSKLFESRQKQRETAAQLRTLISAAPGAADLDWRAKDRPEPAADIPTFQEAGQKALALNPDYLTQKKKLAQENVRIAYAKNQRLPQLDLKASYGLNGLDSSPGASWEQAQSGDYPSFSVGAELRIPLAGGIKGRKEREAAELRKKQALLQIKETETQVLNALQTALMKVQSARDNVVNYRDVVRFDEEVLKTQLARLDAGKVESRKVLEAEADLFEAKNAVVDALVQQERSRLEMRLVEGALLESRHVEWTQKELQQKTREAFRRLGGSDERLHRLIGELRDRYSPPAGPTP